MIRNRLYFTDIELATDCLAGLIRPVAVSALDPGTRSGAGGKHQPTWFGLEFMQHQGSIETRGAFNCLATHREDGTLPDAGITVTAAGRQARAWAYAASRLGVQATIFTGSRATDLPRRQASNVRIIADDVDPVAECARFATATGAFRIDPNDDPLVAAGIGAIVAELHTAIPGLETIVVSGSSNAVVAGIVTAAHHFGIRPVVTTTADNQGTTPTPGRGELAGRPALPGQTPMAAARSIGVGSPQTAAARELLSNRYGLVIGARAAAAFAALTDSASSALVAGRACVVLCTAFDADDSDHPT
ncbi:pyridoxal-phosphate dependent enzyme [Nocardia sp. NPDC059180]|uniref:pyridoxal-phosphate dependent enzyme n=1 Tax=Nocardia sp. NPDC059180 TaxID=3346761 RepID=UPI00369AAC1C